MDNFPYIPYKTVLMKNIRGAIKPIAPISLMIKINATMMMIGLVINIE